MDNLVDQAAIADHALDGCCFPRRRDIGEQNPTRIGKRMGDAMKAWECDDRIAEAANAKNKDGLRRHLPSSLEPLRIEQNWILFCYALEHGL
jgi:hypothetical protein